jgi:TolA-binding protein
MDLSRDSLWKLVGRGLILTAMLSACGTTPTPIATQTTAPTSSESGVVKSLQKQLRERDKRIEELEFQLDALKLIDQDFDKRKKPLRLPQPLPPIE